MTDEAGETTNIQIGEGPPAADPATIPNDGTVETSMDSEPMNEETGETLYAGKFKTLEDFETAYKEAERKIHEGSSKTADMNLGELLTHLDLNADSVVSNFSTDGTLTDEQYAKFAKGGIGKELANEFLSGQQAKAMVAKSEATGAKGRATELAGGDERLQNLLTWASNTITDDGRKAELNQRLDDPRQMEGAIKELLYDYQKHTGTGHNHELLSGTPMPNTAAGYTSVGEFVEAMSKVRTQGYVDEATKRRIANTPDHITQGLN